MHRSILVPLNVGDGFLWFGQSAWPMTMGAEFIPSIWTGFLESIPYGGIPPSFTLWESWSCLSLICQTLLTPHGKSHPFWVDEGGWGEGKEPECETKVLYPVTCIVLRKCWLPSSQGGSIRGATGQEVEVGQQKLGRENSQSEVITQTQRKHNENDLLIKGTKPCG